MTFGYVDLPDLPASYNTYHTCCFSPSYTVVIPHSYPLISPGKEAREVFLLTDNPQLFYLLLNQLRIWCQGPRSTVIADLVSI